MGGRVEIITGPERRRRWSEEEKLQLVEEACRPGHSVSQVARQRGINANQLFAWRRQALANGLVTVPIWRKSADQLSVYRIARLVALGRSWLATRSCLWWFGRRFSSESIHARRSRHAFHYQACRLLRHVVE